MVNAVRDHLDAVGIGLNSTDQLVLGGLARHEQRVGMSGGISCPLGEEARLDRQVQVRVAHEGCVVKGHHLFGGTPNTLGQRHRVVG